MGLSGTCAAARARPPGALGWEANLERTPARWDANAPSPGVRELPVAPLPSARESGGTGRRTSLRSWRGNPWGFESPLSHHDQPTRDPRILIGTDSLRMQTTLDTLGALERRLNVA